jgi:pantoate--beta-alanine ligase
MGALHAGHAALIDRARKLAGSRGTVVVSIFVNPTQFGPKEDLSRYPRPFRADRALCARHGVDVIFHPSAAEMYPADFSTYVEEQALSKFLCGASRPGHFRGVCTVVLKLFTIVAPDLAVFGQKDFQQCAVIRRMVRDLNLSVRIVPVATVREPDGLALSSRNSYLTPPERAQAPAIRRALLRARAAFRAGEKRASQLRQLVANDIRKAPLARVDYLEVVDAKSLEKTATASRSTLIATAVYFGSTRLIDNILM